MFKFRPIRIYPSFLKKFASEFLEYNFDKIVNCGEKQNMEVKIEEFSDMTLVEKYYRLEIEIIAITTLNTEKQVNKFLFNI